MIEINFKYQKEDNIIKCNEDDYIKDLCEQIKNKIKNNKIYFIYEGEKINLELNMTVRDFFQLNNKEKETKCEINVISESIFVQFDYFGDKKIVKIKEDEKVENMLKRYATQINKNFDSIYFLYKGEVITPNKYNFTFNSFASNVDKEANTISILVYDNDMGRLSCNTNLQEVIF